MEYWAELLRLSLWMFRKQCTGSIGLRIIAADRINSVALKNLDCLRVLNLEGECVQDSLILHISKLNLQAIVLRNNSKKRAITNQGVSH